jgi:TolA-binding protein
VSIEIKFEQLERTVRILNDKYAVHGIEADNTQIFHEIRKLKEAVEDCIHNQRELEIQNLDIRRQQREVSFDPSPPVKTITPKKVADKSPAAGSQKKEGGSSEKKEHTYSNLKNKYGNKSKDLSTEPDLHHSGSKKDKFYEDIETYTPISKLIPLVLRSSSRRKGQDQRVH